MNVFKIMPNALIGTILNNGSTKAVKLCLKKDKRLPKHSQEGYNSFIIPSSGTLIAEINAVEEVVLNQGDLLIINNGDSFSLIGQEEDNPFLYFIVPATSQVETHIVTSSRKGCLYSDDSIEFVKYCIIDTNPSVELHMLHHEFVALCCNNELLLKSLDPNKTFEFKLMVSDLLHCHGDPGAKFMFKDQDSSLLVCRLPAAEIKEKLSQN